MKYETPELTALTPAIDAIQGLTGKSIVESPEDSFTPHNEQTPGYADWE
jgi:hypothetical protein